MLWVALAALGALLVAPPMIAVLEGAWRRRGPRDVGFWTLARAVGGTCHVPWGRNGSPVVRFPLPDGEARLRAARAPGRRGWVVEARAYQRRGFRFAARVCSPPTLPARWRAPGLAPLDLLVDEAEGLATDASFEATDERLLRWVLRHRATRRAVDALREDTGAASIEVTLGGTVVLLRATLGAGIGAGEAVEIAGPPLVATLRLLSADLHDLAEALDESEEAPRADACPGCGGELGVDPLACRGCGVFAHRGCREMSGGCVSPTCRSAPDAVPGGEGV